MIFFCVIADSVPSEGVAVHGAVLNEHHKRVRPVCLYRHQNAHCRIGIAINNHRNDKFSSRSASVNCTGPIGDAAFSAMPAAPNVDIE